MGGICLLPLPTTMNEFGIGGGAKRGFSFTACAGSCQGKGDPLSHKSLFMFLPMEVGLKQRMSLPSLPLACLEKGRLQAR